MNILWNKLRRLLITGELRIAKNAELQQEITKGVFTPLQATMAELNRMADVSARLVTLSGDVSLTAELHEGKTLIMSQTGAARTYTLPAATGSGAKYRFVVGAVNTSNYVIAVADGTDTIDGIVLGTDTDSTGAMRGWSPGASDDTMTLNGTTQGGSSIGDWVELQDIAANQWALSGMLSFTSTPQTMFSNGVS